VGRNEKETFERTAKHWGIGLSKVGGGATKKAKKIKKLTKTPNGPRECRRRAEKNPEIQLNTEFVKKKRTGG